MRTTILGTSRIAIATVRQLIERGHEVVLIEQNRERLDDLADTLDCGMIHGDGTLPQTLQDAFGDGAEAFFALTNTDNVNILAAVVARSVGFPRVITQLTRTELQPIIDQLNLGETITPHESAAQTLVQALEHHDQVSTVGVLKKQLRLVLVSVPEDFTEKPLSEIELPNSARGIARIREGEETGLSPDDAVKGKDQLLLLVTSEDHDALLSMFAFD